jgi:isopenicillin N synthase-like dioxygenase
VQQESLNANSIPLLDMRLLEGSEAERSDFIDHLRSACCDTGVFYVVNHGIQSSLCSQVIKSSRQFFGLSPEQKTEIDISRSANFRGFSRMSNVRDWREQVHLATENASASENVHEYHRLSGLNPWPAQLGESWKSVMLAYLNETRILGKRLLMAVSEAAKLAPSFLENHLTDSPYLLMKLICYYPQPRAQSRNGVAAHCDWSWLTVLLQDSRGLQIQARSGQWTDVPPIPDTLVINLGELIEITAGGYFRATPHRVRNDSVNAMRISIPVFINPSLDEMITPKARNQKEAVPDGAAAAHIHRVVDPSLPVEPFVFGDSEWQRKGLGRWCYDAKCRGY